MLHIRLALAVLGACAISAPLHAQPADKTAKASTLPGFVLAGTDLVHSSSGMKFPAHVGTAVREKSHKGDVRDDYVVVRYRVPIAKAGAAVVKIGIVKLAMPAAEHYAAFKPTVLAQIPGGEVRAEGRFPIDGAVGGDGYRGSFVGRTLAGGLLTANFGDWSARLEAEYPKANVDAAHEAVTALATGLDWSPLHAPSHDDHDHDHAH